MASSSASISLAPPPEPPLPPLLPLTGAMPSASRSASRADFLAAAGADAFSAMICDSDLTLTASLEPPLLLLALAAGTAAAGLAAAAGTAAAGLAATGLAAAGLAGDLGGCSTSALSFLGCIAQCEHEAPPKRATNLDGLGRSRRLGRRLLALLARDARFGWLHNLLRAHCGQGLRQQTLALLFGRFVDGWRRGFLAGLSLPLLLLVGFAMLHVLLSGLLKGSLRCEPVTKGAVGPVAAVAGEVVFAARGSDARHHLLHLLEHLRRSHGEGARRCRRCPATGRERGERRGRRGVWHSLGQAGVSIRTRKATASAVEPVLVSGCCQKGFDKVLEAAGVSSPSSRASATAPRPREHEKRSANGLSDASHPPT